MRFKEYGQKKNPAVVLIHPEFTRWNFFEKVIPVLAENYFVIVPVLPGYDEKRSKSVFVSVEKTASDVEKWIVFDDIDMVECIYGCSLGGSSTCGGCGDPAGREENKVKGSYVRYR